MPHHPHPGPSYRSLPTPRPWPIRKPSPPPPPSTPSPFRFVVKKSIEKDPIEEAAPDRETRLPQYQTPSRTQQYPHSTQKTPRFVDRKKGAEDEIAEDYGGRTGGYRSKGKVGRYEDDEEAPAIPSQTPISRRSEVRVLDGEDIDEIEGLRSSGRIRGTATRRYYEEEDDDDVGGQHILPEPTHSSPPHPAKRLKVNKEILAFSDDEDFILAPPPVEGNHREENSNAKCATTRNSMPSTKKFLLATSTREGHDTPPQYSHPSVFVYTCDIAAVGDEVSTGGRLVLGKIAGGSGELEAIVLLRGQARLLKEGMRVGFNEGITVQGTLHQWSGTWRVTGKWGFLRNEEAMR